MMRETKTFSLSLDSLRIIGAWAADCAERALNELDAGIRALPPAH